MAHRRPEPPATQQQCLDDWSAHVLSHALLQVGTDLQPSHLSLCTYCTLPIEDSADADIIACLPRALAFIHSSLQSGEAASYTGMLQAAGRTPASTAHPCALGHTPSPCARHALPNSCHAHSLLMPPAPFS